MKVSHFGITKGFLVYGLCDLSVLFDNQSQCPMLKIDRPCCAEKNLEVIEFLYSIQVFSSVIRGLY